MDSDSLDNRLNSILSPQNESLRARTSFHAFDEESSLPRVIAGKYMYFEIFALVFNDKSGGVSPIASKDYQQEQQGQPSQNDIRSISAIPGTAITTPAWYMP